MNRELLGTAIREEREALHYSQSELAIKCNLTASYISKIEKGQLKYAPSREAIASLATILRLDVYRLNLMAGHIPREIEELVFRFLLAYPKERVIEILELAFYSAIL